LLFQSFERMIKISAKEHHPVPPGTSMKLTRRVLILLLTLAAAPPASCLAQSYSIDRFSIDGGGGASTGGVYTVSGTIGQPDAGGLMTGGQFTLTSGFWALPIAVQSSNAPTLLILPAAPGWATISWTPAAPAFVLQFSPTLTPPAWTNALSGATNLVTVPATLPTRFYRLAKP
jgi:hypothetical protein